MAATRAVWDNSAMSPKISLDRILALVGIAVGIVYWIMPDHTPVTVSLALAAVGVLLFHPIWAYSGFIRNRYVRLVSDCALLAALLVPLGWTWWPESIVITPRRIEFKENFPNVQYTFTVRNKVDEDAYSVNFNLRVHAPDDGAWKLTIPSTSTKPIVEGARIADVQGMSCVDRSGYFVMALSMVKLAGGDKREIILTHRSYLLPMVVTSDVSHFDKEPSLVTTSHTAIIVKAFRDSDLKCNAPIMFNTDSSGGGVWASPPQ
jgi:hypothetical protein